MYFTAEADAEIWARYIEARGDRFNGGWLDGMPCGRDSGRDFTHPELGPLYAVTTA